MYRVIVMSEILAAKIRVSYLLELDKVTTAIGEYIERA